MKTWMTPQLIVLSAGQPQESVLAACKYGSAVYQAGPKAEYSYCLSMAAATAQCGVCSALVSS